MLGDSVPRQAGQGHLDQDSIGPSESLCETNGDVSQQGGTQAGAAEVCMRRTQQRARVPVVVKVSGSGAVDQPGRAVSGGWPWGMALSQMA